MKKLSLLIALILCATIGGVYAAWAYNDPTKTMVADEEIIFSMDAAIQEGTQGTIEITHNFKFKIVPLLDKDPTSQNPNANHTTAIQFYTIAENPVAMADDEATITITFTPNASADGDVKENGPSADFFFKMDADMKYNGEDIITFGATETAKEDIVWEKQEDGSFVAVLLAKDYISIAETYLSDIEEFNTYRDATFGRTVLMFVNEKTA